MMFLSVAITPTNTKPAPSLFVLVIASTSLIVSNAVVNTALVYIPYLWFTRHATAQNFVKNQEDIETYSITLQTRKNGETVVAQSFTSSNYQTVITETLSYAQKIQPSPDIKTKSSKHFFPKAKNKKVVLLQPCLTLKDDQTRYNLKKFQIILPKQPEDVASYWKKIERRLIDSFRLPRIKNRKSPLRYVLLGTTLITLSGLIGPFSLIPTALIALPLFTHRYASVQDFVEYQQDIESYAVIVKIKRHVKTIKGKLFSGPDYHKVMTDALTYAHKEQAPGQRIVMKPRITLVREEKPSNLRNIVKTVLPKSPAKAARYWRRLAQSLANCFVIPNETTTGNITYLNRMAYFGVEGVVLATATPYVAAVPFLL